MKKIKKVVNEASENVVYNDGNKFWGKTKNNIPVEFYVNDKAEIITAYIRVDRL